MNIFENPELQSILEDIKLQNERLKSSLQPAVESVEKMQIAMQPFIEVTQKYRELMLPITEQLDALQNRIRFVLPKIEIPDNVKAISIILDSQYVLWEPFPESYIEKIIKCSHTDMVLHELESENDYESSNWLIDYCCNHELIEPIKLLFTETVNSYYEENYNLSAIGITAILDNILSKTTGNYSHRSIDRCNAILDKLEQDNSVDEEEYEKILLFFSFNRMTSSFYETIDFSCTEPLKLNRNWLMHGRVERALTRLDCIKLIRFLYSILLISDLNDENKIVQEESE